MKYVNPVDNLKNFGRRIFIVHGTGDQFVSFKDSVYVKKHVSGVELKLVSGGDHGFHDEGCMREALDLTMEFLRVKKRKEIEQGPIHGYTGGTCEMSVGCSLGNGRSK